MLRLPHLVSVKSPIFSIHQNLSSFIQGHSDTYEEMDPKCTKHNKSLT